MQTYIIFSKAYIAIDVIIGVQGGIFLHAIAITI